MSVTLSDEQFSMLVGAISALSEQVEDVSEEVETVSAENEELRGEVDELRGRLDGERDVGPDGETATTDDAASGDGVDSRIEWRGEHKGVENLWIDDVPVGTIIENRSEEIDELAADVAELREGRADAAPETRVRDDYTPIERMAALGEEIADSVTDRRALTLFENFSSWASKTPRGLVLKSGDDRVKALLDAAREDDAIADWNQVYRAYERLEELSDGRIEYRENSRHGKLLVLEEPMPSMRPDDGSPTRSSAGA
jgi:archaellum component FlaC